MMQMVYVAADPDQPGAAWAVMVDKPEWAADTARTISEWVMDGAHVMRVELQVGLDMCRKWVKPPLDTLQQSKQVTEST